MFTKEEIQKNKETFIELLSSIKREGSNIDKLVAKLEASDFFTAPASTKYHGAYEGGLCDHSLCVYYNLKSLVTSKGLADQIAPESIIITALLHDFSKMNLYRTEYRNKKFYSDYGSKKDEAGRFDWVAEAYYATVPDEERFIYGSHEETSEYMVRRYIPLTLEESAAILNHHAGMGYDSTQGGVSSKVMSAFPLAALLHCADMLATYLDKA